jgi:hypothetical protein
MNPAFTIKLEQQILPGLVVTGKCKKNLRYWYDSLLSVISRFNGFLLVDGKVPSIACATTGGKILIHSPHEVSNTSGHLSAIRYLNLNRKITALAAGQQAVPNHWTL